MFTRISVFFSAAVMLIGCNNPFAATPDELVQSLRVSPNEVIIHLGSEQLFTLHSYRRNLNDIRIHMLGAKYYDEECVCEKRARLGRLERLRENAVLYIAPTNVRSVILPATIELFACAGNPGEACGPTLAKITILP